ncbi:hypothetical protein BG006_000712, partial [Podila minutissima]
MDHCCPSTDSLHTCPLRTFCCIITSATYPFRILHLDNDALDLFIANSEDHDCLDHHEDGHALDHTQPFAPHHPYHHQQSDFARIQAMAFIKGRSMLDVLVPDPSGTILGSSTTSTTSSFSSPPSTTPENNSCTIQPFVISDDAILVEDSSGLDIDDKFSSLHQQLKPIRRVHVCVHTISSIPSLPSLPSKFSDYRRSNSVPTKYRCYALKDVTEMHGLATASRQGIRASLLLLQVTCFGTIDHAYATSQSPDSSIRDNNKRVKKEDVGPLFMAQQQKTTIETMANNSVMAYAHPSDLRALCRGLDLVCKELYSVFIVRWRIDGRGAFEEGVYVPDVEEATKREVTETAHGFSRAIEYQGEIFEEWEDHTVVPEDCFPFSKKSSSSATAGADEFAWTEITGVLSNGTPLLVVRPMTQPEVEEYRRLQAESEEEARVSSGVVSSVHTEMDGCASTVEFERVSCRPRYIGESEDESDWYDSKEVSSADETVMVPSSASSTTSLSSPSTLSSTSPNPDSALWKLQTRKKEMGVEGSLLHGGTPRVCSEMSIVPLSPTTATCSSHNSSLVLASRTSAYAQCCPNPMMHGRMSSVSSTSSVSRQRILRPAIERQNSSSIPRPMRQLPTFSLTIGLPFVPLLSRVPFVPTTMTTTRTYSTSGTISLPAVALQAWRQWCEVMHRGEDQLCAWCEYVLEMMTAQVAHGVSRGLTMLGWQDGPLDICCPTTTLFGEYDSYCRQMEEEEKEPNASATATEMSPSPHALSSHPSLSKSGLHRAGKVLLTEYPTLITPLNNKLQTLGGSWLGQKVLTRSRGGALEQTLDSVADQVVD